MGKIELLQMGAYPEGDQQALDASYVMHRYHEAGDKAALLADIAPRVRGLATRGDLGASAAVIAALPKLEVISVYGVGYDAVDLPAARARGIAVTNTPDVLTGDVADLALAMWLMARRRLAEAEVWARSGQWAKAGFPLTKRAFGGRAGILGLGRIGRAIGDRLAGFDMAISYSSRAPKPTPGWAHVPDPVALAAGCDVLFVAVAATVETRHVVNAEVLAALGPDGILVNISRAANVDEVALAAALRAGTLGGAALDVLEGEPHYDAALRDVPGLVMLPHIGSATAETRRAMGQLMRDNLAAHFAGAPLLTPVI